MERLPNIDEDRIVEVLLGANLENDYRFDFKELASVLGYTVRKATGRYREDSELFAALLRNELHDYVMREEINYREKREPLVVCRYCLDFAGGEQPQKDMDAARQACKTCEPEAEDEAAVAEVIETNIYDIEEIHENCTVQVLRNSLTGEVSVGWWENEEV